VSRPEADAITTVFRAIHEGHPDTELLAYQYLQMLPQIAQGDANKIWIVPSELGKALEGFGVDAMVQAYERLYEEMAR